MVMRPALINVMAKACEKAGRRLARDFGEVEKLQIAKKGPADFVSTADLNAQKTLKEELMKARPNFDFIGEEGESEVTGASEKWIVDPLDGTTNFLHGIPHFAISIGVEREGEIVAGMIYNPITDEMYWAEKGVGAYCSHTRLRVSGRKELSDCLMGVGLGFKGADRDVPKELTQVNAVLAQTAGIRRNGVASLDLAYVAAGKFDGYWESGLKPWDIAAGIIIVKEAGGQVAPMVPGKNPLDGSLIATNFEVHQKFVKLIRDV